ncbi:MAG: hypothetical protein WCG27_08510, partial [Pseudomonadota bacterium]
DELLEKQFLTKLGYIDLAGMIDQSLAAAKDNAQDSDVDNNLAKITMELSSHRYGDFIDTSKNLTAHIFGLLRKNADLDFEKSPEPGSVGDHLIKYIVKLTAIQPVSINLEVPPEIIAIKNETERTDKIEEHIFKVRQDDAQKVVEALTADYLYLIYGRAIPSFVRQNKGIREPNNVIGREAFYRDAKNVSLWLASYMKNVYFDSQVNQTKWFGRAMVLLLAKWAAEQLGLDKDKDQITVDKLRAVSPFFRALQTNLEGNHLSLYNLMGNKLQFDTNEGDQWVEVQSGDYVLERSYSKESGPIAFGAIPHQELMARAKRLDLVGALNMASYLTVITDEALLEGQKKWQAYLHRLGQTAAFAPGFSHIGQFLVYTDPETGLQATWIGDNYPHPTDLNQGGARFNDIYHMGNQSEIVSLGVAKINQERFASYVANENDKYVLDPNTGEYPKEFWPVYTIGQLDSKTKKVLPQRDPPMVTWKTLADENTYKHLKELAQTNPSAFMEEWRNKVRDGWIDMIRRGTFFNWIDEAAKIFADDDNGKEEKVLPQSERILGKSFLRGAYCSMSCYLASRVYTGIDTEPLRGRWAKFTEMLAPKIDNGMKKVQTNNSIQPQGRIIPPHSLIVQDFVDDVKKYYFTPKTIDEMLKAAVTMRPMVQDKDILAMVEDDQELGIPKMIRRLFTNVDSDQRELLIHEGLVGLVRVYAAKGKKIKQELNLISAKGLK